MAPDAGVDRVLLKAALGKTAWLPQVVLAVATIGIITAVWVVWGGNVAGIFTGKGEAPPPRPELAAVAAAGDTAGDPERGLAAADTSGIIELDTVEWLELPEFGEDEFQLLLNAVITDTEAAITSEDELERAMMTPFAIPRRGEQPGAQPLYMPETAGGADTPTPSAEPASDTVEVDSAALQQSVIDSLQAALYRRQSEMRQVENQNRQLERKLDRLTEASDSLKNVEVKKLAKILESMTPDAAATLLAGRKSEELTMLLFRVKPRTAAKILQALPPDQRASVAEEVMNR